MHRALFGGAFDPPHNGHQLVATHAIASGVVDEVWFVPVFKHPWADQLGKFELTEYQLRLQMLRAQLGEQQEIAEYRGVSFTYDTLEYFSQRYPEDSFSWIMGSEYVAKFDQFLETHPRLIEHSFYIYPRAGHLVAEGELYPNMQLIPDVPTIELSSTMVRQAVLAGKTDAAAQLVHPQVWELIAATELYHA